MDFCKGILSTVTSWKLALASCNMSWSSELKGAVDNWVTCSSDQSDVGQHKVEGDLKGHQAAQPSQWPTCPWPPGPASPPRSLEPELSPEAVGKMPLATRPVSPVALACRRPTTGEASMSNTPNPRWGRAQSLFQNCRLSRCSFRECVTNQTLCQAMRQLASLLKQADDLFQDLGGQVGGFLWWTELYSADGDLDDNGVGDLDENLHSPGGWHQLSGWEGPRESGRTSRKSSKAQSKEGKTTWVYQPLAVSAYTFLCTGLSLEMLNTDGDLCLNFDQPINPEIIGYKILGDKSPANVKW